MNSNFSEIDRKMLGLLLDSEGRVPTQELSLQLGIPLSTVQRRRKKLEREYLIKTYSLDPMKLGYRRIDLLIYTPGGETMNIGKELLKREEVSSVFRTIGEHTIDLRVEIFVKDNGILLDLMEEVKAIEGVRDVVWTEVIAIIGRKSFLNHIGIWG